VSRSIVPRDPRSGRRHSLHGRPHQRRVRGKPLGFPGGSARMHASLGYHPGRSQIRLWSGPRVRGQAAEGHRRGQGSDTDRHFEHLLRRPRGAQRKNRGRSHGRHHPQADTGDQEADARRHPERRQHRRLLRGGSLRRGQHQEHLAGRPEPRSAHQLPQRRTVLHRGNR
ncbi:unnamed protein product, partial [Ixodes persulcatus]